MHWKDREGRPVANALPDAKPLALMSLIHAPLLLPRRRLTPGFSRVDSR